MTNLTFYFGGSSNAPEKKVADTWKTSFLKAINKKGNNKKSYKAGGTFFNKKYDVHYKGKNFKYQETGHLNSGLVKTMKIFEDGKLKEKWVNVNYNVDHYLDVMEGHGNKVPKLLKLFNNYMATYFFGKNDVMSGKKGNDNLWGYGGNDKISGGSGNDILNGGKGNDLLVGGKGNDTLIGGKGKDIFKLSTGKGYDLIHDFKNKEDKIFTGSMKKLKLKNKGKDVYIYKGKDLMAKVKGAKGDLSKKSGYLV